MNRTAITCTTIATLGLFASAAMLTGGPLDPPAGPVASTYKTLAEVEPRMPISATNTPGDSNSSFRITQSGSYYLTGNFTGVSGRHAIEIAASNVTIDLMGFALIGVAGSLDGITTDGTRNHLTIRNGVVRGWGSDGINLTTGGEGRNSNFEGVDASWNTANGIHATSSAVVRACSAFNNGLDGIYAPSDPAITACTARLNGADGIRGGAGAAISDCTAIYNGGRGISVGHYGSIINSTASSNTEPGFHTGSGSSLLNCSAMFGESAGIAVSSGCTVTRCSAHSNLTYGITMEAGCSVIGNTCRTNGELGTGDGGVGIRATGTDNRIEGNTCIGNGIGFNVTTGGNFIARNVASGSTTNWVVVAGNVILVVQAADADIVVGNTGGVSPGSSNPNANYTY